MAEPTLYERLGGIFAIAAVVDHFSDQLLKNPKVVEANPELNEWHTAKYPGRLPGLKFLRTLWVAALAGGPFQYTARELRDAHFDLKIAPRCSMRSLWSLAAPLSTSACPSVRRRRSWLPSTAGRRK
jgi:hemoglobin